MLETPLILPQIQPEITTYLVSTKENPVFYQTLNTREHLIVYTPWTKRLAIVDRLGQVLGIEHVLLPHQINERGEPHRIGVLTQ